MNLLLNNRKPLEGFIFENFKIVLYKNYPSSRMEGGLAWEDQKMKVSDRKLLL